MLTAPLPVDPCLDVDLAEERLHDSLRRAGWTDRQLLWRATLTARAVVWLNHLRAAGLPFDREARVMREAQREVGNRKTELTTWVDPEDAELLAAVNGPDRRIPHRGGLPDWMLTPPAGWLVETT